MLNRLMSQMLTMNHCLTQYQQHRHPHAGKGSLLM
jgi:hypothetical protein